MTLVDQIPVAKTPTGGWTGDMPAPILAGCDDPLVEGAPDLRGMWKIESVEVDGALDPEHPMIGMVQRIEQAADRLIVTAGRVIHDMRCDGTRENGVNDVAEFDCETPIQVVATFEDGVHTLRPVGMPIEVLRRRDGERMIWSYAGVFIATCVRTGPPNERTLGTGPRVR